MIVTLTPNMHRTLIAIADGVTVAELLRAAGACGHREARHVARTVIALHRHGMLQGDEISRAGAHYVDRARRRMKQANERATAR